MKIISINDNDYTTIEKPLWFHNRGLMETSTGYGRKLRTTKMLRLTETGKTLLSSEGLSPLNRLYRIYVCCFSNSGSAYIRVSGRNVYVD
jgi:hypothetical protein